jgi:hypothetical protein
MQPTLDIHRHSDGSIDFDFYRRRATRERRRTKQMLINHYLTAVRLTVKSSVLATAKAYRRQPTFSLRASTLTALIVAIVAVQAWVMPR